MHLNAFACRVDLNHIIYFMGFVQIILVIKMTGCTRSKLLTWVFFKFYYFVCFFKKLFSGTSFSLNYYPGMYVM